MLTVVSLPRAFAGAEAVVQDNAVASWRHLPGDTEIILFGDDPGVAEAAVRHGVRHEREIRRNEHGRPYLDGVFERAQQLTGDVVAYVNADIILTADVVTAVDACRRLGGPFLLVSRRHEIEIDEPIGFAHGWERALRARVASEGLLAPEWAVDLFVFPSGTVAQMPPFLVGRPGWDGWMVYSARERGIPVVDATKDVLIVHQDIEPGYARGKSWDWTDDESRHNLDLAGWGRWFDIESATHVLVDGVIRRRRAPSLRRWWQEGSKANPRLRVAVSPARGVVRSLRRAVRGADHPEVLRRSGPPAPPETWIRR